MIKTPFIQFGPFSGIDNVNDDRSLTPDKLRKARGVMIDNSGFLFNQPSVTLVDAGAKRDMHISPDGNICLLMEGTTLYRFNADEALTPIRTGLAGAHMSYEYLIIGGRNLIAYSDGSVIELTDGTITISFQEAFNADMSIDNKPFKKALTPGNIVKFYRNRLYTVLGGRVRYSDPLHFTSYDTRIRPDYYPGLITMFMPVTDGIWMSFAGKIYFLAMSDPLEGATPVPTEKANYPALGQAVYMRKGEKGSEGMGEKPIRFMTSEGICVAGDSGAFQNQSIERYRIPKGSLTAYSYMRIDKDISHFITTVTN